MEFYNDLGGRIQSFTFNGNRDYELSIKHDNFYIIDIYSMFDTEPRYIIAYYSDRSGWHEYVNKNIADFSNTSSVYYQLYNYPTSKLIFRATNTSDYFCSNIIRLGTNK